MFVSPISVLQKAVQRAPFSAGTVTVSAYDDAIHPNCGVVLENGATPLGNVTVSGGSIILRSNDDGINGTATSGTAIAISGGKLYVYASGDGVDSNSTTSYTGIIFSGGTSVIISTGQSDSSIDTERGYKYTGGYVIGIGRSGGMGSESTNCSNFSSVGTSKTLSLQKDVYLTVNDIATVKMPVSISALVVCLGKTSASISSSTSTSYNLDANGVYWNVN